MLNVLVACEESQRVCKAFRTLGDNAYSCDILPCSGGEPQYHINQDVTPLINGDCSFITQDGTEHYIDRWDIIIAHPPCTYLTVSGNRWYNVERYGQKAIHRVKAREKAVEFFMQFINASCEHVLVENPVGYMNTHFRKPDQTIQPYQFGDNARKTTCLWLKGLPKLEPTDIVSQGTILGDGYSLEANMYYVYDNEGKSLRYKDPQTAILRSKTFPGIAKAIASQYHNYLTKGEQK